VEGAHGREHRTVAGAAVEHAAGDEPEDDSSHRAAKSNEAGHGAHDATREEIGETIAIAIGVNAASVVDLTDIAAEKLDLKLY